MSKTFIKIDSPKHLEISRGTYPTNRPKIRFTIHCFDVNAQPYIPPWREHYQCFTFKICNKSHTKMY